MRRKVWKAAIGIVLSVMAASFFIVSCASAAEPQSAAQFTPGTYTAKAEGNHGEVTVSVTFSATKILKIEIGENEETAGISDAAFTAIPDAIVKGQTLKVDTVAGATNSSKAVLAAVADCVRQAGGDVEALSK